ncbi:MAG TPA: hypothetical protein VJB06_04250, partial [archaeon]|nr:hypothetical protein [archaeon]
INGSGERVYFTRDSVNAQPDPVFQPTGGVWSPSERVYQSEQKGIDWGKVGRRVGAAVGGILSTGFYLIISGAVTISPAKKPQSYPTDDPALVAITTPEERRELCLLFDQNGDGLLNGIELKVIDYMCGDDREPLARNEVDAAIRICEEVASENIEERAELEEWVRQRRDQVERPKTQVR